MGAIKDRAIEVLAHEISAQRKIPLVAAEDHIEHVQDLVYDYLNGENTGYASLEELYIDYGIPKYARWVFECNELNMNKL